MADFFHVYIKPKGDITSDKIEEKLNLALDWYRYTTGLYVLYSNSDPQQWYSRLEELVKDEGRVFICKLDVGARQGWMNKDFWEWLNKDRTAKS